MSFFRSSISDYSNRRILIKIGTDSITDSNLRALRDSSLLINENNGRVIIVTSGAKAFGESKLKESNNENISYKQLCCAIGQPLLMQKYNEIFGEKGYLASQYLLTSEDLDAADKKSNFVSTLECNLKHNAIIPILNYNDSLAKYELERVKFFSDNDRLAAAVAFIMNCDLLILLTNAGGLFRNYGEKNECLENTIFYEDARQFIKKGKNSLNGTGGMESKIEACGIFKNDVLIANAKSLPGVLANNSRHYTLLKYKKE